MYQNQINEINTIIDKTNRAIVSLGCSFVQGQGAFNEEIVQRYGTTFTELGDPLRLKEITEDEKENLLLEYPRLLKNNDGELNFTFMEYDNAFTNVLCKKYLNSEYAPINLGQRGNGNRATIKELYFYPDIHWNNLKEIIVIYCPSGPERFDFINDQWMDHSHWISMWPHTDGKSGPREKLWSGYKDGLYSNKFEVLEQIAHVQELMTWCKLHNAKLIITPAFDNRYNRNYFVESLNEKITRSMDGTRQENTRMSLIFDKIFNSPESSLVDLFPWDAIFEPDGMKTFADMAIKQEFPDHCGNSNYHFWSFIGKGTPDNWITPCAHPSAKAHDYFAKLLSEHITGKHNEKY